MADEKRPRDPRDPHDQDIYRLVGELMADLAQMRGSVDESLLRLRERGHENSNALQRINIRFAQMETTIRPLAEEIEEVRKMRKAYEIDRESNKTLTKVLLWAVGIFGGSVLALAVWVVTTTWDSSYEVRQVKIQLGEQRQAQQALRTDVTSARETISTMTAEIRADRTRQDDRWDRIKETLDRLEKRRPR